MTPLAQFNEQQQADMAWTRCAAEEIRLRRLLAERTEGVAEELQGELSYSEERLALRLLKGEA